CAVAWCRRRDLWRLAPHHPSRAALDRGDGRRNTVSARRESALPRPAHSERGDEHHLRARYGDPARPARNSGRDWPYRGARPTGGRGAWRAQPAAHTGHTGAQQRAIALDWLELDQDAFADAEGIQRFEEIERLADLAGGDHAIQLQSADRVGFQI